MREPAMSQYMRRQQVAFELNIGRQTLARMLKSDPTFPAFFDITVGVSVIAREDFDKWLREKRLRSQMGRLRTEAGASVPL